MGSLAGGHNDPEPGLSIYSGTKHAVEGLSEALRFELARVGVDVSLIQPDGSFLDKCLFDQHHKYVPRNSKVHCTNVNFNRTGLFSRYISIGK